MAAGFVHGVLNTDNMNITGESFDYGPWRFTEFADPEFTAAYFDQQGLYAYGRQANAVEWNLVQLGISLTRIAPADELNTLIQTFEARHTKALTSAFFARLGIKPDEGKGAENNALVTDLMRWMREQKAPIEQVFFDWFGGAISSLRAKSSPIAELYQGAEWLELEARIKSNTPERPERLGHTYFAREKPCTMLIDEVEDIWSHIDANDDWSMLTAKIDDIAVMREALDLTAG
jgi:uncharacterized protein YdiU (UPF0061 family)